MLRFRSAAGQRGGMNQRIVFHVGGPSMHPTDAQAGLIRKWLGKEYDCTICEGGMAFERLADCDLLVLMGLYWTKSHIAYRPLTEEQRRAFGAYAAAGRPILVHHAAIISYDDWPRFAELVGFQWVWRKTNHAPYADFKVTVVPTGHPIVAGVADYQIRDELYYDVQIAKGWNVTVHAEAEWQGRKHPLILTAPRRVYLANGHNMEAFECPALKQIWINAVRWLTGGK